ncbi:MAG: hypothetical protein H0W61_04965 [Bacteroidetes bacterium]|nr:hypothetical protein [Bacteroidota bacterium]
MTRFITYISVFLLLSTLSVSQTRVIKPVKKKYPKTTNFGIGVGVTRSVIYLNRNVKENNDARGYSFSLIYGGSNIVRASIEYTHYRAVSIEPTWYDIKASTIEANIHVIARFKKTNAFFYPLAGISYNMFSGFFTGRDDFLNLSEKYPVNQVVTTNWAGLNIGTGYEHYIKPFSVFIDYKMRIGITTEKQLNIMDVCFTFGIRYNFKVPSIYKIFSGTRSRYFLDSEPVEK